MFIATASLLRALDDLRSRKKPGATCQIEINFYTAIFCCDFNSVVLLALCILIATFLGDVLLQILRKAKKISLTMFDVNLNFVPFTCLS